MAEGAPARAAAEGDSLPSLSDYASPTGEEVRPRRPVAEPQLIGATSQWGHSLIDTRAYGRLKTFSGKEEEWCTWSFVARSYLDLLSMGFRDLLTHAEAVTQATEIRLDDMTGQARTHAWTLFNVLTQSVEGRALSIIMNAESSNGLQAWRLLVDAYEPKIGGRYTAMLMGILSPQWSHVQESNFLETLDVWEVQVRRYEEQSRETVTPATKCAIIMKNAPGGIRTALRTSSSIIGSNYEMLKKALRDYLQTGADFDPKGLVAESRAHDSQGPAPMDVGAVWKGGRKGKEKGKGKKGQSKDKGKDKGVKGKMKSSSSKKFDGYCSYCWKWGHKKADCRIKEKDKSSKEKGKGSSTNAVDKGEGSSSTNAANYEGLGSPMSWKGQGTGGETPVIEYVSSSRRGMPKKTSWADAQEEAENEYGEEVDYGDDDEDKESCVSAVTREISSLERAACNAVEHSKYIMFDSGSDEHVCKVDFGGRGQEQESKVKLNAVSGDALSILGERKVILVLAGTHGPVEVEVIFQVSKNAQKNILSSGKLFRKGFSTVMNPKGYSYLTHDKVDDQIPLFMYGNSFYLRLVEVKTVPMTTRRPKAIVAPVVGGDAEDWENVGGEDPEEEEIPRGEVSDKFITSRMSLTMRSTVKYLGYTVHGEKAQLWNRLKKAEREEFKRQEKERLKAVEMQMRHADTMHEGAQVKTPKEPTEAERARHNLTHLPTAEWCEHCTKGKGKEDPHKRVQSERAVIQIDYSYLKADGSHEETAEDAAVVVVTAADRGTGMFIACSVPAKNFEKNYVVKSLRSFVAQLGHIQVTIRSDGEPSILQINHELRDEINKMRGKDAESKAHSEQAPRYSAQSMGAVGAAQKTLKGDFLTMRSDLENKIQQKITPAMNIWPWMIRHAAWVRGRFGIKANMRTAYEDAYGSQYTGQILPFGEVVLFKVPHSASGRKVGGRQLKGDSSWERGVFLGKVNESDEFLVGNTKGAHSVRTVRRLEEKLRWDKEAIMTMRGVPWNRETTIGRPRRAIAEAPAARAAPTTPKPEAGMTGSRTLPVERGSAKNKAEGEPEEKQEAPGKKARKTTLTDSSARLEPMEESNPNAMGSGLSEERKRQNEADRAAVEERVKKWQKQDAEVEARYEGGPPKKLKVGDQTIGALFTATEEDDRPEEAGDEDVEIDEDLSDVDPEDEEDETWKDMPITDEERAEGKAKELAKMSKFKTFKPVPKKEAVDGPILDSTWVEARKPDKSVRMRYCLRDFKSNSYRDDVYAVSTTSATGRVIDLIGAMKNYHFFTADATNAFWQVPIKEKCYMYPPKEWLEEERKAGRSTDVMWELLKEWYGRRVAGTMWVEWAAEIVVETGCLRNTLAPWLFHHPTLDISLELHMDDIYGCGPPEAVKEFLAMLHKKIEMKSEIHAPGGKPFYHLKRKRTYAKDGSLFIQSDAKHLKSVKKLLHMEGSKGAVTPAVAGGSNFAHGEVKLNDGDTKKYKTAVGTLMYMAPDRPDCQFAIRELTKNLKEPKVMDMQALVRLTRYLIHTADYGIKFKAGESPEYLDCYSDTDWGNCKRTRKSTACGVFKVGGCVLASYCRGLAMICLSSGEAEFNGGVSACSEGLFYHQILGFLGLPTKMRVFMDSSAARGVFQRQGTGRIRHLEVKSLWVQQALKQKKFSLHAVGTNDNTADVGTKALPVAKLEKFRSEMNVISEVEFRATEQEKIHTTSSVVGAINKLQTVIQVMTALGMVQPAKAEKKTAEDTDTWVFYGLMFCVLWTMMTMVWTAISAVRGWMKSPKKSSETEEGKSQCVRGGVQEKKQNLRQRGVKESAKAKPKSSAASSSGSEMVRPSRGDTEETRSQSSQAVRPSEGERTPRSESDRVDRYGYEKKPGKETLYDKCYPFEGESPPAFYKTVAGECVHMNPKCHGLRNRKSPVQQYRVCMYCHLEQAHNAIRLIPAGRPDLRAGDRVMPSESEESLGE